ncbi:uncharacterized protein G2W53_020127 [Senna tora]|uniref:Uncharacterized protein n=1 Tax=Senna tora TaxID=362788 RepID=A0A834WPU6_9FABA|nr:uncharacterized protein G2W53_020127 [Senna tora]
MVGDKQFHIPQLVFISRETNSLGSSSREEGKGQTGLGVGFT